MIKTNIFFVLLIVCTMHASEMSQLNSIEKLHEDHCEHIQKYLNYQDLNNVILTNKNIYFIHDIS